MTVPAGAPASVLAPGEDRPVWHTLRTDQVLQAEQVNGPHGLGYGHTFGDAKFGAPYPVNR